jgi:hypothetical protein
MLRIKTGGVNPISDIGTPAVNGRMCFCWGEIQRTRERDRGDVSRLNTQIQSIQQSCYCKPWNRYISPYLRIMIRIVPSWYKLQGSRVSTEQSPCYFFPDSDWIVNPYRGARRSIQAHTGKGEVECSQASREGQIKIGWMVLPFCLKCCIQFRVNATNPNWQLGARGTMLAIGGKKHSPSGCVGSLTPNASLQVIPWTPFANLNK